MILSSFNWSSLIVWAVVLGVYFIGLGVFVLIKRHKNKKKFDKEVKEHEENKKD